MQESWGEDFEDEPDDSLQEEFGEALDESIEQKLSHLQARSVQACSLPYFHLFLAAISSVRPEALKLHERDSWVLFLLLLN